MAEGGAAIIFVGVARHAEVRVIALLLASAFVIAGGEAIAVRLRSEPRVLILLWQPAPFSPVHFIAFAAYLSLLIAFPPSSPPPLPAHPSHSFLLLHPSPP